MIKVLFICHGNICRSTMCESVFTYMVKKANLSHEFDIDSAATSREEIGNPPHHGTVNKLNEMGIPVIPHKARQMSQLDYQSSDYIIAMDEANVRNIRKLTYGDPDHKVYKLLSFTGSLEDVADPWYTGDFDATFRDSVAGCRALLEFIKLHRL